MGTFGPNRLQSYKQYSEYQQFLCSFFVFFLSLFLNLSVGLMMSMLRPIPSKWLVEWDDRL